MSYNPVLDLPKSQMYQVMTALGIYDLDGGTLVRYEMRAYLYGLQVLRELTDKIRMDWHPLTCEENRLMEWEGLLGIPPREGASVEERRQGVLRFWALGEKERTPEGAGGLLAAVGLWGEITEDFGARKVKVKVTGLGEGYASAGVCLERLRELLPAHLGMETTA